MRVFPLFFGLLCLAASPIALAAEEDGAWTVGDSGARVAAAGIAVPTTAASLALDKTGEFSNGGKSIDNYAQYVSADGAVQATAYVYLPTYADAALGAYMTDRAIMERFGGKTHRISYESAAAGGKKGMAIRAVYADAADGELTTAAAFVHAGRWMVKLRVTGPSDRQAEVVGGMDAMLAGLRFDQGVTLHAAAPPMIGACPVPTASDARLLGTAGEHKVSDSAEAPGFPRDGQDALCVRGKVQTAQGSYDMLQAANGGNGSVLVPMDDTGTVMAFDPLDAGKTAASKNETAGYRLSIHSVGKTEVYDAYDRLPSGKQIAAILDGSDPVTAQARSTTAYAANGETQITLRSKARR